MLSYRESQHHVAAITPDGEKDQVMANSNCMTTFNTAFNSGAVQAVTAGTKTAAHIIRMIDIAFNGKLFAGQKCMDYTLGVGEFHDNKAKGAYKRTFCKAHSPHYNALCVARDQVDADGNKPKSTAKIAVTGTGRMLLSDIKAGISRIEQLSDLLVKALAGIYNMKKVDRVHVRKDGQLGVTIGGDQEAMSAKELARKAPRTESEKRGKAEDIAKAIAIAPLAVALSSKLAAIDTLNDIDQKTRDELATLMAVMIGLQIGAMDDAGNSQPVSIAA